MCTASLNSHQSLVTNKAQAVNDIFVIFVLLLCRRVDGQLLSLWNGCEIYFLRSVARLALLNICLQNPSRDLGPPAVERCRGFAAHLMVSGAMKYLQS